MRFAEAHGCTVETRYFIDLPEGLLIILQVLLRNASPGTEAVDLVVKLQGDLRAELPLLELSVWESSAEELEEVLDNEMNLASKKGMHYSMVFEKEEYLPPPTKVTEWFMGEVAKGTKKVRFSSR